LQSDSHARRRFERKTGGFLRAQFCTEVARSEGFEPPTPRFEVLGPYPRWLLFIKDYRVRTAGD
jgi:hypothetical protein